MTSYRDDKFSLDKRIRELENENRRLKEKKKTTKIRDRLKRIIKWEYWSMAFGLGSMWIFFLFMIFMAYKIDKCSADITKKWQRQKEELVEKVGIACKEEFDCEVLSCNQYRCLVKSKLDRRYTFTVRCTDGGCYVKAD
jgi:BMFP domain-containing protein YqiC